MLRTKKRRSEIIEQTLNFFVVLFLIFLTTTGHAIPLPFFSATDLTPYWETEKSKGPPAIITEFKVIDQNKNTVTEASLKNQISLVNFFFADCPSFCPTMMHSIQNFQKKFETITAKVNFYSFSVQPKNDPPEKLKTYATFHKIDQKKWSLLTGDETQIFHVGKDMFKADGSVGDQKKKDSFIHTGNIYLVDKKLRIRGIYDTANADSMNLLASDIQELMQE